ncbi:hypothetical protein FG05_35033 [Fusarium graminearum]|nr:hypothetical protein FG05_35033 [Fusarium graminearum]
MGAAHNEWCGCMQRILSPSLLFDSCARMLLSWRISLKIKVAVPNPWPSSWGIKMLDPWVGSTTSSTYMPVATNADS